MFWSALKLFCHISAVQVIDFRTFHLLHAAAAAFVFQTLLWDQSFLQYLFSPPTFFRIKFPDETFQEKITWHLININGMVYLADAMGLYTWWKHVKVCLCRLFIKTTRWNTPNYWTPKYEIQNVLVQERSAGGRYDIGIYYFHQYFDYLKQQISFYVKKKSPLVLSKLSINSDLYFCFLNRNQIMNIYIYM